MYAVNPQHKAALDKLLLRLPMVTAGKAFGYPAYKANGRAFAFVGATGVVLKLPEARIRELVASHRPIHWFEPTKGMIWGDWAVIQRMNSADYWQDQGLFEEAIHFAMGDDLAYNG
jgi:hypothetical protein